MLDVTPLPFSELPVDTALAAEPVAQPTADWAADLAVGDIVSFRFPMEDPDGCAVKKRPCLVLEVEGTGSARRITLAYGTTVPGGRNRGYEVRITHTAALAASNLREPSKHPVVAAF